MPPYRGQQLLHTGPHSVTTQDRRCRLHLETLRLLDQRPPTVGRNRLGFVLRNQLRAVAGPPIHELLSFELRTQAVDPRIEIFAWELELDLESQTHVRPRAHPTRHTALEIRDRNTPLRNRLPRLHKHLTHLHPASIAQPPLRRLHRPQPRLNRLQLRRSPLPLPHPLLRGFDVLTHTIRIEFRRHRPQMPIHPTRQLSQRRNLGRHECRSPPHPRLTHLLPGRFPLVIHHPGQLRPQRLDTPPLLLPGPPQTLIEHRQRREIRPQHFVPPRQRVKRSQVRLSLLQRLPQLRNPHIRPHITGYTLHLLLLSIVQPVPRLLPLRLHNRIRHPGLLPLRLHNRIQLPRLLQPRLPILVQIGQRCRSPPLPS